MRGKQQPTSQGSTCAPRHHPDSAARRYTHPVTPLEAVVAQPVPHVRAASGMNPPTAVTAAAAGTPSAAHFLAAPNIGSHPGCAVTSAQTHKCPCSGTARSGCPPSRASTAQATLMLTNSRSRSCAARMDTLSSKIQSWTQVHHGACHRLSAPQHSFVEHSLDGPHLRDLHLFA